MTGRAGLRGSDADYGQALGGILLLLGPLVVTPAAGVLLAPMLNRYSDGLRRGHVTEWLVVAQFVLAPLCWIWLSAIDDPQQNCDPFEDAASKMLLLYVGSALLGAGAVAAALATSRDLGRPIVCAILSLVGTYAVGFLLFLTAFCTYT